MSLLDDTPSFISPALSPDFMAQHPSPERPLQLGIMASGSGTNFEAIAAAIAAGELNARIPILIYNNPDAKVKARAERFGVKAILLSSMPSPIASSTFTPAYSPVSEALKQ